MSLRKYIYCFSVLVLHIWTPGAVEGRKIARIHNGDDANPNRFHWMVWIKRNGAFVCGGALLTKKYVITAAQCVDRPGAYHVVLGDHDRGSMDGQEQITLVAEKHVHPSWNRMSLENDIALLKLDTNADLSRTKIGRIQVSKLSTPSIDELVLNDSSIRCLIYGWGYYNMNGVWMLSPLLQTLEINLQNQTRCAEILMGSYNPMTRLCFENQDSGACSGDNGGPWMCYVDSRWTLLGIHSYGMMHDGCRAGGRAGTRVSHYVNWIMSVVKNR